MRPIASPIHECHASYQYKGREYASALLTWSQKIHFRVLGRGIWSIMVRELSCQLSGHVDRAKRKKRQDQSLSDLPLARYVP